MAPSATTTVTETVSLPQTLKTPKIFGAYKELAPSKYNKEAEEGKTGLRAAKVRYTNWCCRPDADSSAVSKLSTHMES